MSYLLHIEWVDVNGETGSSSAWVASTDDGLTVAKAFKAASNARITSAELRETVPLQTITNNTASNNNVETAKTKAKIKMRGADAGSLASPFAYVTVGIPAPIGTLINGVVGDTSNTDANDLASHVLSPSGVQMSSIEKIYYGS